MGEGHRCAICDAVPASEACGKFFCAECLRLDFARAAFHPTHYTWGDLLVFRALADISRRLRKIEKEGR